MKLKIKKLSSTAILPEYAHSTDSGMDLFNDSGDFVLEPLTPMLVSTGIAIALPFGYEAQIRPKSGLNAKGVTTFSLSTNALVENLTMSWKRNSMKPDWQSLADAWGMEPQTLLGTIDNAYRGELKVVLINVTSSPVSFGQGQKIAQLVVTPVVNPAFGLELEVVSELDETDRGKGGFGSTGDFKHG